MSNAHAKHAGSFFSTASMASMAGFYVSPFLLELNSLAAMAQGSGTSDYRALVCVYLQGGNDGHGTVVATDPDSYAAFRHARQGRLALLIRMADLLPVALKTQQSGRSFALNPDLTGSTGSFQRQPRRHHRQYRHTDHPCHQRRRSTPTPWAA